MSIALDDLKKLSDLAQIALDPDQVPKLQNDISKMIDRMAELDRVDTEGVEPMSHPLQLLQRLRTDEVTETDSRDDRQKLAPAIEAGLYLVPKVIETEA